MLCQFVVFLNLTQTTNYTFITNGPRVELQQALLCHLALPEKQGYRLPKAVSVRETKPPVSPDVKDKIAQREKNSRTAAKTHKAERKEETHGEQRQ